MKVRGSTTKKGVIVIIIFSSSSSKSGWVTRMMKSALRKATYSRPSICARSSPGLSHSAVDDSRNAPFTPEEQISRT